MDRKTLGIALYCEDCKIELTSTIEGIICPSCNAYINDEELEDGN